jgi:Na+/H+-dicarboxylate symporter
MLQKKIVLSQNTLTILALLLGIITGLLNHDAINSLAGIVSDIVIRLMKLVAMPLLFLSIVSSAAHFQNFRQIKRLGIKITKYTVLTTLIAALVAELLYIVLAPFLLSGKLNTINNSLTHQAGFFDTLLAMIPDNLVRAFLEGNVMAVVIIAIILAISIISLKEGEKELIFSFFVGLCNAVMNIVHFGLKFIPIAVWAFVTILINQMIRDDSGSLNAIFGLTMTVIIANIIQGIVVLPIFLRLKKISPLKLFVNVKEALILAFLARSSMAALPATLDCAVKNAKISQDVARLSLPLCTTINMNGCAQFILLSVYFVSAYTGNALSSWEHVGMVFLSVVAAIGNAGIPMGCFFLASSILASADTPLHLMGSILPFYAFIDMVETALNVWSDVSITKVVDRET